MPSVTQPSFRTLRAILPLAILLGLGGAQLAAQERCEGTLCDLFYGSAPPPVPVAKPAAPTPLMAPTSPGFFRGLFSGTSQQAAGQAGAGPAVPSRVQVGGGGLAAMARGDTGGRCEGTLCDLYYGGSAPAPEEPGAAPIVPPVTAAAGPDDGMDEGTRQRIRFRQAEIAEAAKPHCTSKTGDPWKCYR